MCGTVGRRLAPVGVLLAARAFEQVNLADGETSDAIGTPLSLDLNQALAPLLNALSALPLLPDFELDPATLSANYTVVPETGSPGGKPYPRRRRSAASSRRAPATHKVARPPCARRRGGVRWNARRGADSD